MEEGVLPASPLPNVWLNVHLFAVRGYCLYVDIRSKNGNAKKQVCRLVRLFVWERATPATSFLFGPFCLLLFFFPSLSSSSSSIHLFPFNHPSYLSNNLMLDCLNSPSWVAPRKPTASPDSSTCFGDNITSSSPRQHESLLSLLSLFLHLLPHFA